jgi:chromate transporter
MALPQKILVELATTFLHLGATAFGGPAAHIALMERELVERRGWLERQEFLDLMGATNLIPGPNSTELAIHIGHRRAGMPGLIIAGISFILPAALMVLLLAWGYVRYQTLPQISWVLTGVQPVVIAVVVHALWKLGRSALKDIFTLIMALGSGILVVTGLGEVTVIFLAALVGWLWAWQTKPGSPPADPSTPPTQINVAPGFLLLGTAAPLTQPMLGQLFLIFLKIGSIVYGSGYVLLAFLRDDFVEKLQWITDRQLLDAIAIGQLTPGPLFTSATFIGYLIQGVPGAMVATLGIFLPSFIFVVILSVVLKKVSHSPRARVFLDSVNAASLALMALVTWELGRSSVADAGWLLTALLGGVALLILSTTKINTIWLILVGAFAGYLLQS